MLSNVINLCEIDLCNSIAQSIIFVDFVSCENKCSDFVSKEARSRVPEVFWVWAAFRYSYVLSDRRIY